MRQLPNDAEPRTGSVYAVMKRHYTSTVDARGDVDSMAVGHRHVWCSLACVRPLKQSNRDHDAFGDACDYCGSLRSTANLDGDGDGMDSKMVSGVTSRWICQVK